MTKTTTKQRLLICQSVFGASAIVLALLFAQGYAHGQAAALRQLPTATPMPSEAITPTEILTQAPVATPTAIVGTIVTSDTSQDSSTATTLTETATITGPVTTLPADGIPTLPQIKCGPRILPGGYLAPEPRYVFPVQPPEVASYGEAHHDYPATDILAPRRSVFVAVTDGVIDELSYDDHWDPAVDDPALRSGRYVTIIGDDGVRYHGSHLDEVVPGLAPGDRVVAGQLLGYVGNSGNARGIAHHLHFGISYPTYAGDWETRRGVLSPYPYLQAWARHEVLKPDLSSVQR